VSALYPPRCLQTTDDSIFWTSSGMARVPLPHRDSALPSLQVGLSPPEPPPTLRLVTRTLIPGRLGGGRPIGMSTTIKVSEWACAASRSAKLSWRAKSTVCSARSLLASIHPALHPSTPASLVKGIAPEHDTSRSARPAATRRRRPRSARRPAASGRSGAPGDVRAHLLRAQAATGSCWPTRRAMGAAGRGTSAPRPRP